MPKQQSEPPYKSFLVRLWWEDEEEEPEGGWRGEVEAIQTGQKREFGNVEEMVRFLQMQMVAGASDIFDKE